MKLDIDRIEKILERVKTSLDEYRGTIPTLSVTKDPTTQQLKELTAKLDELYTPIRLDMAVIKTALASVENFIDFVEKTEQNGKTAVEKKGNGMLSASNYNIATPEAPRYVNLYSLHNAVQSMYNQLDALVDIVEKKHNRLILDLGLMKIEGNLVQ